MEKFNYTFKIENGLNAPNANQLIKEILKYSSSIKINKNNKTADARIIFNVLSLNVSENDTVEFTLTGDQEEAESSKLKEYLETNF